VNDEIEKTLIAYLVKTPKALALAVFSYLSGQLWLYLIFAHFRTTGKGKSLLDNFAGKMGLGVLWHGVVLVPLYLIQNGATAFDHEKIFALTVPVIVFALVAQTLVLIIVTIIYRAR
jgi:asparagine N-glycosylation enzyme membrane subunit Stt3